MWKRMVPWLMVGSLLAALVLMTTRMPAGPAAAKEPVAKADKKAEAVKATPSRVVAVTVYPTIALVTREVDVPEGAGTLELTVTPLPPSTIHNSMYTEG